MTLTEAKTLIDEWCYENKHNILTAYYSGDVFLKKVDISKAVVVIVDRFEDEFTSEIGDLVVIAVKNDDFWVSVLAYSGIVLEGEIGGFDFVLTGDKKLRRKSQCVKERGEFKCIANPPTIIMFNSISEVLKYETNPDRKRN